MFNTLSSICTTHLSIYRQGLFGLTCLAAFGAVCAAKNIANEYYQRGRCDKEREMKKEYKKYLKNLKKQGGLY